jgi:chromosome segregation ATPase
MRLTLCVAVLTAACGLGLARPARGQSLGEVSRKEEERRKDMKSPAKVYTNKDLGAPPASAPIDSAKSAAPATPQASKDASKAGDDKSKDVSAKDQAYWAKRKKELQDRLDRSKTQLDGMQTRINALTADFASHDDPVQRAGIERDRQRALGELARLQQDIKDTQKALADLDEEARKAGVPPGWLR